jgi:hypothetical protein
MRPLLLVDPDRLHANIGAIGDPSGAAHAVYDATYGEVGPEELVDPSGALRALWPSLTTRQRATVRRIMSGHGVALDQLGQPIAPLAVPLAEGGAELVTPAAAAAASALAAAVTYGTGGAVTAARKLLGIAATPWWVWALGLYVLFGGKRR